MLFSPVSSLHGEITVSGDKSISHRAVMFGAISKGCTRISHFLTGADCLSTISCFSQMGIAIEQTGTDVLVHGKGLHGLSMPADTLYTGNSGTTTRLISGILAAQTFSTTLTGDASIEKRPMKRVILPLSNMGANITSIKQNDCAPLYIQGAPLHGIHYASPVASAQVKSAILLAGLYADSPTSVSEPFLSRNHTELMLGQFGASVTSMDTTATIDPCEELFASEIVVPGDISSAAYFIAAGLLVPNSEILIKNVGINSTRNGIIEAALKMGADISFLNVNKNGEPTADLLVRSSSLHGTIIEGDIIPKLIDEIPVLAIMAALADGQTIIRDAAELKVKESNRIETVTAGLQSMGCDITPTDDGMIIQGGRPLKGAKILSHLDHRIAMSFAIASLVAEGTTTIEDFDCVSISYPAFINDLNNLIC